jgi:hypothetical protein
LRTILTIIFITLFLPVQALQKPPVSDYCEMLERDIQGKMYSFIAGNHMYYIGGKVNEYWNPVHSETIGFTHPMFRDGRARGYGIASGKGGKGHDKFGWEFWNHVKGAVGTVIIDGKKYRKPAPEKMLWRPDRVTHHYKVAGVNIKEVKFIAQNDVLCSIITADKDIAIEFEGHTFANSGEFPTFDGDKAGQNFSQTVTATARFDQPQNSIHIVEGGTILTKTGWKETQVGKIMYDGMSVVLSASQDLHDVSISKDNVGRQVYKFKLMITAGEAQTLTYSQHDDYSVALARTKDVLKSSKNALNEKTTWFNGLLNEQIPYFRCSDQTAVNTYYYLWSLYFMYFTETNEGFETYPHTQTAINNFMGLHLWDSWAYTAMGSWVKDKWQWGYGNVLSWKHMVPFKNKANGLPDNFGTTWYSPEVWMNLVGSVEFGWDMYRKSGDEKFLNVLYNELFKPLYWEHNGPQASMGEELNALQSLIKMAKELGQGEDVAHWQKMHPRMYKAWANQWEGYAPGFFAPKGSPWKDIWNIISLMNLEMPQEWADEMTDKWVMNPEEGFLGPIALLIRPQIDPPNGVFTVSTISTWLATEGLFRHGKRREGVHTTLSHINGMNKTHGFPVAPECWEPKKFGPWGSLYYNWDGPITDLLIKRIAGIDFSQQENFFAVNENLPETWQWLETYTPVTVEGKTQWVFQRIEQESNGQELSKVITVKNSPFKKLIINPWTDSREVLSTSIKGKDGEYAFNGGDAKFTIELGAKSKKPKTYVTIKPIDRKFFKPLTITLQNLNRETTLRYTLDGSEPTVTSPIYSKALTLSSSCDLKMKSWDKWGQPYETSTVKFTKEKALISLQDLKLTKGLNFKKFDGKFSRIPDMSNLTPSKTGVSLNYEPRSAAQQQHQFALQYTGYIKVPKIGQYTFHLKSDDGSRITIGDQKVVELNILSDRDPWESKGSIPLSVGFHKLQIDYFQHLVHSVLEIEYSVDGGPIKPVTADMLYREVK